RTGQVRRAARRIRVRGSARDPRMSDPFAHNARRASLPSPSGALHVMAKPVSRNGYVTAKSCSRPIRRTHDGPTTEENNLRKRFGAVALVIGIVLIATTAMAFAKNFFDFGTYRDDQLAKNADDLFGFKDPVAESSTKSITQAQALADPTKLATLAKGLHAK